MPVAEFYTRIMDLLGQLGIEAVIRAHPNEVEPAIPFAQDEEHGSYDAGSVTGGPNDAAGHYAAHEAPQVLIDDIRQFFVQIR